MKLTAHGPTVGFGCTSDRQWKTLDPWPFRLRGRDRNAIQHEHTDEQHEPPKRRSGPQACSAALHDARVLGRPPSYQCKTRIARNVIHWLRRPSPSSRLTGITPG